MKKSKALNRIMSIICALVLIFSPFLDFAPALALPVGVSGVSTLEAFKLVLEDPAIGTIELKGNIDASALTNWKDLQKGGKRITSGGAYSLSLPAHLLAAGELVFDNIRLSGTGVRIYAGSYPFTFGAGVNAPKGTIESLFGGAYMAPTRGANISLFSGHINKLYTGGNSSSAGGAESVNITVYPGATVENVYAAYADSGINGTKNITYRNYGSSAGFAQFLPNVQGFDNIVIENSFIQFRSWPAAGSARVLSVKNSTLWLDGSMSLTSGLHGENSNLIVTGGSTITMPSTTVAPVAISGRFNFSVSAGANNNQSVVLAGGAGYLSNLVLPQGLYPSGSPNLTIQSAYISKFEFTQPTKKIYKPGEALNTSGGILRVYYEPASSGLTKNVPVTPDMVSGYNPNIIGRQTLNVNYEGKLAGTYNVHVEDTSITRLSISSAPRSSYQTGDDIYLESGAVRVYYQGGLVEDIPFTDPAISITGFDTSTAGERTVSVYFNERLAGKYTIKVRWSREDEENRIRFLGVPNNGKVRVGDRFRIRLSKDIFGYWEWDDRYFSASVNDFDNSLVLTAIEDGESEIYYFYGNENISEKIEILERASSSSRPSSSSSSQKPSNNDDFTGTIISSSTPPTQGGTGGGSTSSIASQRPPVTSSSSASEATSESASSKPEKEESSKAEEKESSSEPEKKEEPEEQPGNAENTDSEAEKPKEPPKRSNVPLIVAGVGAAISLIGVAGISVWQIIKRVRH